MFAAQVVPQLGQQGVVAGVSQVVHIHFVGHAFTARCTHADEARTLLQRPCGHGCFGFDLVTRVNHGIDLRITQEMRPVLGFHKFFYTGHDAIGIDVRNALAHRLDFGHTDGGVERMDLSVDVGFGHMVKVNQRQAPHPAAGQGFTGL